MSVPFNPTQILIIFSANIYGPQGSGVARLALDTGATQTTISHRALRAVGTDPAQMNTGFVPVLTANGVISVPLVALDMLDALGQQRPGFIVQAHTLPPALPPALPIDGVLGMDFIRGGRLVVDFRTGQISLT